MRIHHRSLPLFAVILVMSGCGSSSYDSTRGTDNGTSVPPATTGGTVNKGNPAPTGGSTVTGSENAVEATSSSDALSVMAGTNQTISVSFNSSDGLTITGFGVSGNFGSLPAGWSAPDSFTCASVSTGNGCVLNLTFAPSAAGSGTISLNCVFVDNATLPVTPGPCLNITYAATAQNNVISSIAPTGQITAVANSGSEPVVVNFMTDDGHAATGLTVTTDLTALPAGWTASASALTCPVVTTGSGCQLALTFAPTTATRGTLSLDYSYTDDSGAAKTSALNIPYSTATRNSIVATTAPSGQITAAITGTGQAVPVTFTTDDGKPATNLMVSTDLAHLPTGWRSASNTFSCGSAGAGNGCQLRLTYAPTALGAGTLVLNYSYDDSSGAARKGVLDVSYAATTNDNVAGTASPSGQINAIVGAGTQAVTVTFNTDDSRQATALQVTSDLTALPGGWSNAAGAFACAAFSIGSTCQLTLMYSPPAAATGMLTLTYIYVNNAGVPKTGTLNIPYRATTDDNVVGTPSQSNLAVQIGTTTTVNVVFTTDDANLATLLAITSGLTTLPTGWSAPSNIFVCASVGMGSVCQLQLTYAPVAADAASMSLGFSYVNDSAIAKTGTVTITYAATP